MSADLSRGRKCKAPFGQPSDPKNITLLLFHPRFQTLLLLLGIQRPMLLPQSSLRLNSTLLVGSGPCLLTGACTIPTSGVVWSGAVSWIGTQLGPMNDASIKLERGSIGPPPGMPHNFLLSLMLALFFYTESPLLFLQIIVKGSTMLENLYDKQYEVSSHHATADLIKVLKDRMATTKKVKVSAKNIQDVLCKPEKSQKKLQ